MVVVRESPHAKHSPDKNSTQWPPRSPFQALLSSPSGRRKWQDRRNGVNERNPSPSAVKKGSGNSQMVAEMSVDFDDEGDDVDEDEEMLQLKLQAVQAKLKLKKLQKAKKEGGEKERRTGSTSRADSLPTSPKKAHQASNARPRVRDEDIEVPLSPTKDRNPPTEPVSPARRRLGLSNAPNAQEVSLKRARDGTQIKRLDSARRSEAIASVSKELSFSERLNQSKAEAQDHQAKQERLEKMRSRGFGHGNLPSSDPARSSGMNGKTTPRATEQQFRRPSSAHQLQPAAQMNREAGVARSASTRTSRADRSNQLQANGLFHSRKNNATSAADNDDMDPPIRSSSDKDQPSPGFDDFSQIHLSKRHIAHVDVARAMEGKEIYTLPRLLKEVKAPHYDPPDCEADFVVFAVLASKSTPFDQKATHRTSDENKAQDDADGPRNKFMVFHLCDLKWEVDCFLFGTAFDQFWKLTPGTLLAILNPSIMPPKGNQNSGRFSLKLGSSEDCVMEIGVARDLGYCSSMKKDGQPCGAWVDQRSTEICEFHLNLEIDRNRKHRMEVNTMWRGKGNNEGRIKSQSSKEGGWDNAIGKGKKDRGNYHREYGRLYSVPGGGKKSAANLLDAEDTDALHSMTQEEASRKRIANDQRERNLAKKLGEIGNGVGAEYLRVKQTSTNTTKSARSTATIQEGKGAYFDKPSASELGLLGKKAQDQHLSPAKDRKRHFGLGAISSAGSEAIGWGGARKAGLLQPKESKLGSPEKGQTKLDTAKRPGIVRGRSEDGGGSLSPSKKRARFMLEEGIREPGRESLGEELKRVGDEDEDELDIV